MKLEEATQMMYDRAHEAALEGNEDLCAECSALALWLDELENYRNTYGRISDDNWEEPDVEKDDEDEDTPF